MSATVSVSQTGVPRAAIRKNSAHVVGYSVAPVVRPTVARRAAGVCHAAAAQSLGPDKWNDTYYPTASDAASVHKDWYIVDAEGKTLGRVASLVANHIRGKNSPGYTPSMDMGAFVIVINADKIDVTGKKEYQKIYHRHTVGRPGSWKKETLEQVRARIPERILEKAVKGMLPKGRIGSKLFNHLKVYKGASHPHEAQKPKDITQLIDAKPSVQ
ncbi:hypothetical protein M9435_000484 [Picochlorum sp. BPE23]|nr:hypothetical protein M9435_000484 [Picochlorum sp. BPE23]